MAQLPPIQPLPDDAASPSSITEANIRQSGVFRVYTEDFTGEPTFTRPEGGFIKKTAASFMEDGNISNELGFIGKAFLGIDAPSVLGGYLNKSLGDTTPPGPFVNESEDGWLIQLPEDLESGNYTQRLAREVPVDKMFDSLDPLRQIQLIQNGFDVNGLRRMQISSAQDFAERWPELSAVMLGRQWVQSTKQDAPVRSGLSAVFSVGSAMVLDPWFIASLGAIPIAKQSAKKGAQETIKQAAKRGALETAGTGQADEVLAAIAFASGKPIPQKLAEFAADGLLQTAATESVKAGRKQAGRAIVTGGGVTIGSSYGAALGYAQQSYDFSIAARGPEEGVDFPWLGVAAGGILGLAGGELTLRHINQSYGDFTSRVYMENNSTFNLASEAITRKREANPKSYDEPLDVEHVAALEQIDNYFSALYTGQQVKQLEEFSAAISKVNIEDSVEAQTLRDFLLQFPTHAETMEFVKIGSDGSSALKRAAQDGEIPTTRWKKNHQDLWALRKQREKIIDAGADVAQLKKINRAIAKAANEVNSIAKELKLDAIDREHADIVRAFRRRVNDIPVTDLPSTEEKISKLREILNHEETEEASISAGLVGWLYRGRTGKIVGVLNPAIAAKVAMASEDKTERLIGKMFGLVDNRAFVQSERMRNPDGTMLESAVEKITDFERRVLYPLDALTAATIKDKGPEATEDLLVNYMRAVGGLEEPMPEVANLVRITRESLDDTRDRALKSGTLEKYLDNFVPTLLTEHITPEMRASMERSAYRKLREMFDPKDNLSGPVHNNTLARLGYVTKEKGKSIHVFNANTPEGFSTKVDADGNMLLPEKVSDIAEEFRGEYLDALDRSLKLEADLIIHVKEQRRFDFDPDNPEGDLTPFQGDTANARQVSNYVKSDQARRVTQDIFLDEEVLRSGAIEITPYNVMNRYQRGVGYNTYLDEVVSNMFGQPVKFSELIAALRQEVDKGSNASKLLDKLEALSKYAMGRQKSDSDWNVFTQTLSNLTAATALMGIGPTIVAAEGTVAIARALTRQQGYTNLVENLKDVVLAVKSEGFAKSKGFESAVEQGGARIFDTSTTHLTEQAKESFLIRGSSAYVKAVRTISFERPLSNAFKSMNYNTTYGDLWRFRRQFDKIEAMDLGRIIEDPVELRKAARELGMHPSKFSELKDAGILDKDMIGIAKKIHAIDNKALSHPNRMRSVLLQLGDEDQKLARTLDDRLQRIALKAAQDFVATPSAITRASSTGAFGTNPLVQMLTVFSSWANTFQAATLARVGEASYVRQAGFFGIWLASEVFNSMYRDMVYNGFDSDQVMNKWTEEPEKQLSMIILRSPMFGSFNPLAGLFHAMVSGYGGAADTTAAAPLNFLDRAMRNGYGAMEQLAKGERPTDAQIRNLKKIAFPTGLWWIRGTERIGEGFESER